MSSPWRHALPAASLAAVLSGCALPDVSVSVDRENHAPEASLRAPVIAPVGVPVRFEAAGTFDVDADPVTFTFEVIGYASPEGGVEPVTTTEPWALLTFPAPGLYTVELRAVDLHGAEGLARQDVTARLEFPDPPDFCSVAADCVVGDECDGGICYATGGGLGGALD